MTQFPQELIDNMKAKYAERGETISDYEANDAMNRLCEFFKLLNEMDLRQKAAEAAKEAEQQATSQ